MLRILLKEEQLSEGSAKTDIYQLGMVIYQVLFQTRPFSDMPAMTPKDVAKAICQGTKGQPLYPTLPEKHDFGIRLISIMQQCWLEKTEMRPEMDSIVDAVTREFASEGKGNVIDQMIRVIDDYQKHLEAKVELRTKHLEDSLQRTEDLLFHIMPRRIAETLRMDLQIRPEMHNNVSVMVADVCRFTELCETTIPVQVIEILQDLFSSFDDIVSRYEAFKVENVGDGYLLVSGLEPTPYHLREVCRIALDIIHFVDHYHIKHNAKLTMKVKLGIHSGAVASGILGSSAPRFCIFGDTVNMACRMANLSEPQKIQMSESIAETVRTRYPGFNLEERGFVDVKGKGPVYTFYLIGCIGSRHSPRDLVTSSN